MAIGPDPGPRSGDAEPPEPGRHRRQAAGSLDSLLRQAALGDAEAFAGICDQVTGAVYGVVSRIVADPAAAEQVTEEVLLEVWQSASQFSPAENSGLNWIITRARRRALSQSGSGPAEVAVRQTAGSLSAHDGIASLPGPQREAVLLASCGYTWHQVADAAGAPPGTAAEWLRDGLLRLSGRPQEPEAEAGPGMAYRRHTGKKTKDARRSIDGERRPGR